MTDEEFLDAIEAKLFLVMLIGCSMDDHLGRKVFDPAPWAVTLRSDQMSRLLDMVKAKQQIIVPWSQALESEWGEAHDY